MDGGLVISNRFSIGKDLGTIIHCHPLETLPFLKDGWREMVISQTFFRKQFGIPIIQFLNVAILMTVDGCFRV